MKPGFKSMLVLTVLLSFGGAPVVGQQQSAAQRPPAANRSAAHPDLSGIWRVMNSASWDILDHVDQPGIPAGRGVVEGNEIPYRPEALDQKKRNFENRATADPETKCNLPGVPRITYMPFPFQIVQTPKQITMLYEYAHAVRNIFMDLQHPRGGLEWWLGDSRGHWEGNTLVVDVADFNDMTWFDRAGDFHSKALHVVERYTPAGPDHMKYEALIEDPQVFTRPWKMSMLLYRLKENDAQLLEYECFSFESE
jgi:hypothetical protein